MIELLASVLCSALAVVDCRHGTVRDGECLPLGPRGNSPTDTTRRGAGCRVPPAAAGGVMS